MLHCRIHLEVAETNWLKMLFLLSMLMMHMRARRTLWHLPLSAWFMSGN
jgi:hypothetical protein